MSKIKLLLILLCFLLQACQEKLVHGLKEQEANKLMTELYNVNLNPEKNQDSDGNWTVSVPKYQLNFAMQYLDDAYVIKEQQKNNFNSSSILSTRDEQRFKYERSLSQEIEYTILNMSDVFQARVHLNLPVRDPLLGKKIDEAGSAAVLVIVGDKFKIEKNSIKKLVAGAAGINIKDVSIIVNKTKIKKLNIKRDEVMPLEVNKKELIISLLIVIFGFLIIYRRNIASKKNKISLMVNKLKEKQAINTSVQI